MAETAKIIEIAEAVKDALNAAPSGTFNLTFEAERGYVPVYELPDLQTLKVTVIHKSLLEMPADGSRGKASHHYQVDIGIQKKCADLAVAEFDALTLFVEQIADYLRAKRMAQAAWISTENDPVFIPEHIEEYRQFTSVLTVTYRGVR